MSERKMNYNNDCLWSRETSSEEDSNLQCIKDQGADTTTCKECKHNR